MDNRTGQVIDQLRRIEEQVRDVTRMVEDGASNVDIIHHVTAIRISFHQVRTCILENYLRTCLVAACDEPDEDEQAQALDRIARVLNCSESPPSLSY